MPGLPGTWVISGQKVMVDNTTQISKGLTQGTPVEVIFSVLPNQAGWLAESIMTLEVEVQRNVTSTQTQTLTPSLTKTLPPPDATSKLVPNEIVKNTDNRCTDRTKQQPEALRLAARFGVTYDEIMKWFCAGFGFGEIDLAYDLRNSSGQTVDYIFGLRTSGLGWGEIRKQLATSSTLPNSNNSNGKSNGNGKGNGK
jgi:hypothetical protein